MRRPVQPLVENGGHSSYQEGWRGKGGGWLVAIRGGGEGGRGARSVVDPGATPLTAAPPRRAVTGGRDEEKERKTSEGTPRRCFRGGGGGYPPNRRWGLHDAPHRTIHPRCSLLPPPPPTPPPCTCPRRQRACSSPHTSRRATQPLTRLTIMGGDSSVFPSSSSPAGSGGGEADRGGGRDAGGHGGVGSAADKLRGGTSRWMCVSFSPSGQLLVGHLQKNFSFTVGTRRPPR